MLPTKDLDCSNKFIKVKLQCPFLESNNVQQNFNSKNMKPWNIAQQWYLNIIILFSKLYDILLLFIYSECVIQETQQIKQCSEYNGMSKN